MQFDIDDQKRMLIGLYYAQIGCSVIRNVFIYLFFGGGDNWYINRKWYTIEAEIKMEDQQKNHKRPIEGTNSKGLVTSEVTFAVLILSNSRTSRNIARIIYHVFTHQRGV